MQTIEQETPLDNGLGPLPSEVSAYYQRYQPQPYFPLKFSLRSLGDWLITWKYRLEGMPGIATLDRSSNREKAYFLARPETCRYHIQCIEAEIQRRNQQGIKRAE